MEFFSKYIKLVSITDVGGYKHYVKLDTIHHISENIVSDYIVYLDDGTKINVLKSELNKLC